MITLTRCQMIDLLTPIIGAITTITLIYIYNCVHRIKKLIDLNNKNKLKIGEIKNVK